MRGKYLSELFDPDDFGYGSFQLIKAGTGAGKTTFAINVLAKEYENVLYLIDTVKGKKQLLQRDECIDLWLPREIGRYVPLDYWEEFEAWLDEKITVMTYSQFGYHCRKTRDFSRQYDLIICDEIHNLIQFIKWDDAKGLIDSQTSNNHMALDILAASVFLEWAVVIALSATPDSFLQEMGIMTTIIEPSDPTEEIMSYETAERLEYGFLQPLLGKLDPNERGLIYVPRINQMKECVQILKRRGINAVGIWSENNTEYKMSDEQWDVNNQIIEHSTFPDNVQVLLINKSCETSVNITTPIDYIVVHSSNHDTITQVRGRFRGDLKTLYVYDKYGDYHILLDEKWLDKPLFKEDKDALCKELGIKINGRLQKWPSVKKILCECDYVVKEKKSDSKRFSIITKI